MSGVHYCFIARDSDMIVFEKLVNRGLNPTQLTNEAVQLISAQEKFDEEQREKFTKEGMERLTAVASLECHLMFDIVFIGLVTSTGYGDDKAQRFLTQMHQMVTTAYADNLAFIKR